MKFENILPALKAGKTITRKSWCSDKRVEIVNGVITVFLYGYSRPFLTSIDIMADDWIFTTPVVIFDIPKPTGANKLHETTMPWWESSKRAPEMQLTSSCMH